MLKTHSIVQYDYWLTSDKQLKKINWETVLKKVTQKELELVRMEFIRCWWYKKAEAAELPDHFEKALMKYWLIWLENQEKYSFIPRPYGGTSFSLATSINLLLLNSNLKNWLEEMKQSPKLKKLIYAFFYQFEKRLTVYIQNPYYTIYEEDQDNSCFNLKNIEYIYDNLPDLEDFPDLKEKIELSQGLLILVLAIYQETKGLLT